MSEKNSKSKNLFLKWVGIKVKQKVLTPKVHPRLKVESSRFNLKVNMSFSEPKL